MAQQMHTPWGDLLNWEYVELCRWFRDAYDLYKKLNPKPDG